MRRTRLSGRDPGWGDGAEPRCNPRDDFQAEQAAEWRRAEKAAKAAKAARDRAAAKQGARS